MPKSTAYSIAFPHLPTAFDGFRIAHISDLHNHLWGRFQRGLLDAVRQFCPHIVVMTGDIFDSAHGRHMDSLRLCRDLSRKYPVYFVSGNHEQSIPRAERLSLYQKLSGWGVDVLDGGSSLIRREGSRDGAPSHIRVCGLALPELYYKDPRKKPYDRHAWFSPRQIERVLGEKRTDEFTLLLAHNPVYFPSYRDWGADLTFSGHMHGGIVDVPFLGPLLSPEVSLFPRYAAGHFMEQGRHLLVSRGLANTFAVRVFNPMELLCVTLCRAPSGQ